MGKASSSKKVARAAGTGGGRTTRTHTPWPYVGLIAVIVVLGVAFTITSRSGYENKLASTTNSNAAVAPTVGGAPWNEAYVVDICGKLSASIKAPTTRTGITTDGNGVIRIAPKVKSAAGKNATLGVFASSVGMKLAANQLQLPGGKDYVSGDDCGSKPAQIFVKQYGFVGDPIGVLQKQDPKSVRLADDALVTIAFVPPADKGSIPAPPAYIQDNLKKIQAASTTTTPTTATTTKGSTATTTKGSTGTTTKGSTGTTTKGSTGTTTKGSTSPTTVATSPSTS
jgi:hypothetical protein